MAAELQSSSIPLAEGTPLNFPTGTYQVGRLLDGALYMVSVDVTEEQRLYLAQLDTAELYQHQAGKVICDMGHTMLSSQ